MALTVPLCLFSNWNESNKYSFKEDPERETWILEIVTCGPQADSG